MKPWPAILQMSFRSKDGAAAVGILVCSVSIRDDKWNPVDLQKAQFRLEKLFEAVNGEEVFTVLLEAANPF